MVYEVIGVEHPTPEQSEKGQSERVVFGPVIVVAKVKETASTSAVLMNAKDIENAGIDKGRLEVIVRPFVSRKIGSDCSPFCFSIESKPPTPTVSNPNKTEWHSDWWTSSMLSDTALTST